MDYHLRVSQDGMVDQGDLARYGSEGLREGLKQSPSLLPLFLGEGVPDMQFLRASRH